MTVNILLRHVAMCQKELLGKLKVGEGTRKFWLTGPEGIEAPMRSS